MACSSALPKFLPNISERVKRLGLVSSSDGDYLGCTTCQGTAFCICSFDEMGVFYQRQALLTCSFIYEHEQAVGLLALDHGCQIGMKVMADDDILHDVYLTFHTMMAQRMYQRITAAITLTPSQW